MIGIAPKYTWTSLMSNINCYSGEKRLGEDSKEIDDLIEAHSNKKKKKKKHVRN